MGKRVHLLLPDDELEQVDAYRFAAGLSSLSKAIAVLTRIGTNIETISPEHMLALKVMKFKTDNSLK